MTSISPLFAVCARLKRVALCIWLLSLAAPSAAAQQNALTLERNLAELVSDASLIVAGRVLSVKAEPHPQLNNIHTVVVTLQVSDVLKGQAQPDSEYTFRLFANDPQDFKIKLGYAPGQELLLMLTRPSQYGFSSPIGLEQGRFRITKDEQGKRTMVNGQNNYGLFARISEKAPKFESKLSPQARQLVAEHRGGPIAYDQLKAMIQILVNNPQ